ncbi:MAG TPA: hypothetical protein VMS17_11925 [Gemmataceae bacterium]|nr:hypothetical protein [Gemmataceae bacterium]
MAIVLHCPCGRKLQIKEEFAGQEGQCPACGRTLAIPRDDNAPVSDWARPAAISPTPMQPPAPTPPVPPRPSQQPDREADVIALRNHGDGPLPQGADFFAPAPQSIGPLRSAATTLRVGKEPMNPGVRLLVIGAVGLGGVLLTAGIELACQMSDAFWMVLLPLIVGGVAALITLGATGFRHTCTYVGRDGVARFVCSGGRERLTVNEVFLFRDAADLRTAQTHYYRNGVYQNTSFAYTWYDVGGRKRYAITGAHNSQNSTPPHTHYFHYAKAAELAWTIYLSEDVDRQLQLSGSIHFNLTNGQWIRLGRGVVVLGLSGEPVELDSRDIGGVQVQKGVVRIKRYDAEEGWFSSRGVYKFDFAKLANAQLFFFLMNKVVGVRVS